MICGSYRAEVPHARAPLGAFVGFHKEQAVQDRAFNDQNRPKVTLIGADLASWRGSAAPGGGAGGGGAQGQERLDLTDF
jgi:hypothetical protein